MRWITLQEARDASYGKAEWWKCRGLNGERAQSSDHAPVDRPVRLCGAGSMYFGGWKDGKWHGFGVFHFQEGCVLAGTWDQNNLCGPGKQILLPASPVWKRNRWPRSVIHSMEEPGTGLPFIYVGHYNSFLMEDSSATVILKDGTTRRGPWKNNTPEGSWWEDHEKSFTSPDELAKHFDFCDDLETINEGDNESSIISKEKAAAERRLKDEASSLANGTSAEDGMLKASLKRVAIEEEANDTASCSSSLPSTVYLRNRPQEPTEPKDLECSWSVLDEDVTFVEDDALLCSPRTKSHPSKYSEVPECSSTEEPTSASVMSSPSREMIRESLQSRAEAENDKVASSSISRHSKSQASANSNEHSNKSKRSSLASGYGKSTSFSQHCDLQESELLAEEHSCANSCTSGESEYGIATPSHPQKCALQESFHSEDRSQASNAGSAESRNEACSRTQRPEDLPFCESQFSRDEVGGTGIDPSGTRVCEFHDPVQPKDCLTENNRDSVKSTEIQNPREQEVSRGEGSPRTEQQRPKRLASIIQWLTDTVIGHGADPSEMEDYASRFIEEGFHSVEMIQYACTIDDVTPWMRKAHVRLFSLSKQNCDQHHKRQEEQLNSITTWLENVVIGHGADKSEMKEYAKHFLDDGLHSIQMIQATCTREDVMEFSFMKKFHKRRFLLNAGLKDCG